MHKVIGVCDMKSQTDDKNRPNRSHCKTRLPEHGLTTNWLKFCASLHGQLSAI